VRLLFEHLRRYPLANYLKSFLRPGFGPPVILWYDAHGRSSCLIGGGANRVLAYFADLNAVEDAPRLRNLESGLQPSGGDSHLWRQTRVRLNLDRNAPYRILLDSDRIHFGLHDASFRGSIAQFKAVLAENPGKYVPHLSRNAERYVWEILDTRLRPLADESPVPARAVFVGVAESYSEVLGNSIRAMGGIFHGLYPAGLVVLRWITRYLEDSPHRIAIIPYSGTSGHFTALVRGGEVEYLRVSPQPLSESDAAEAVLEVTDLALSYDKQDIPIVLYGESSERLAEAFRRRKAKQELLLLDPDYLNEHLPLDARNFTLTREAWTLNYATLPH